MSKKQTAVHELCSGRLQNMRVTPYKLSLDIGLENVFQGTGM